MFQFIVKDFQSIDLAKLSVDGLTLVVGESCSGKSALLRALQSACTNRFKSGQVQYGKEQAVVAIKVPESEEALNVIRSNKGGSPTMKLGGKSFTKTARTIPLEVSQFLNMEPLQINGEVYYPNFHSQFQKPLLLEYSQAKVMELLSASSSLDDLKLLKDFVLLERNKVKGAVIGVDSIISDTNKSLEKVSQEIEDLEPIVTKAVEISNKVTVTDTSLDSLSELAGLYAGFANLSDKVILLNSKYDTYSKLLELNSKLEALQELSLNKDKLNNLSSQVDVLTKLQQITILNTEQLLSKLQALQEIQSELLEIVLHSSSFDRFTGVLQSIVKFSMDIEQTNKTLDKVEDLKRILYVHSNIRRSIQDKVDVVENHICPICKNKIS